MRKYKQHRTADFYKAKTPKEKLFYSGGIPSENWLDFKENFNFIYMGDKKEKITQSQQHQNWSYDVLDFSQPYLIIIGGVDYDKLALSLSYELMKKALCSIKNQDKYNKTYHRIQITDASLIKEEKVEDEDVLMLINVFSECTIDRIQSIRDWVYKHKEYYRLIAMTGNPFIFSKKCGLKPNMLLYVEEEYISV